jgi:YD repeat-containing protein
MSAVTDALGNRSEYQYDSLNRKIAIIDANNQTSTYVYDAVGNLLSLSDPAFW